MQIARPEVETARVHAQGAATGPGSNDCEGTEVTRLRWPGGRDPHRPGRDGGYIEGPEMLRLEVGGRGENLLRRRDVWVSGRGRGGASGYLRWCCGVPSMSHRPGTCAFWGLRCLPCPCVGPQCDVWGWAWTPSDPNFKIKIFHFDKIICRKFLTLILYCLNSLYTFVHTLRQTKVIK